jgi:hypothetical protein
MPQAWTVKDSECHQLPSFTGASRLELARKVVPNHYDAFRLQVSSSYREMLDRDLAKVLARSHWQVVRTRSSRSSKAANQPQLELKSNWAVCGMVNRLEVPEPAMKVKRSRQRAVRTLRVHTGVGEMPDGTTVRRAARPNGAQSAWNRRTRERGSRPRRAPKFGQARRDRRRLAGARSGFRRVDAPR